MVADEQIYFKRSLVIHVLILGTWMVIEGIQAMRGVKPTFDQLRPIPKTLRVDLVGLPQVAKKDLVAPVSKEVQEKQAKKAAPKAEVETVPNKPNIQPSVQKAKHSTTQSALKRLRALERIHQMSEEDAEANETDASQPVYGNRVSKGTSLSGDAREGEETYLELLRNRLQDHWALPAWLAKKELSAQVKLKVDALGNPIDVTFIKSSGQKDFDRSVRATIQQASPLPRPPKAMLENIRDSGVVIGFPL